MADYPAALPRPQRTPYQLAPNSAKVRTEMDAGPARMRQRYTNPTHVYRVSWQFTTEELGTFQKWYHETNNNGVTWFNVDMLNGAGIETHEARFPQEYQAQAAGFDLWVVTAMLEIRNPPIVP